jgi:hypothetical protein
MSSVPDLKLMELAINLPKQDSADQVFPAHQALTAGQLSALRPVARDPLQAAGRPPAAQAR